MDEINPQDAKDKPPADERNKNTPAIVSHGVGAPENKTPVRGAETSKPTDKPTPSRYQRFRGWLRKPEHGSLSDRVIAFFTIVIAVAAVMQYVIFSRQLDEMRRAGADTQHLADAAGKQAAAAKAQTEKMAELVGIAKSGADNTRQALKLSGEQVQAAKRSAKAAEDTVRQTYQSMRSVERAWVGPADYELTNNPTTKETAKVRIIFKNTGRTPALDFTAYAIAYFRFGELPKGELPAGGPGYDQLISRAIVFPNATAIADREAERDTVVVKLRQRAITKFLTQEEIDAWGEGHSPYLYIIGHSAYDTVFEGLKGETGFCVIYFPKPKPGFINCGHPQGNYAK